MGKNRREELRFALAGHDRGHIQQTPRWAFNLFLKIGEKSMFQTKTLGVALLLAMTFLPFEVLAQPKYAEGMMFCTSDMDGKGLALVKLSNLTKLTIPKGKALFAKKSNETIEFTAAEPIAEGGSATYRTHAAGFQVEGPCEGWY